MNLTVINKFETENLTVTMGQEFSDMYSNMCGGEDPEAAKQAEEESSLV